VSPAAAETDPASVPAQVPETVFYDAAYAGVARLRGRLWPQPRDSCPVAAPELRARFLD